MTKEIQLTQGQVAIVDDEDYEWLNQWKWCAVSGKNSKGHGGGFYAIRRKQGMTKNIIMHRIILNATDGLEVDHINGDGLNNTRSNLRLCTHNQNVWNRKRKNKNMCGYTGVHKRENRFRAEIRCNGKKIIIGSFESAILAAEAYDKKATELFGEFASLNFPDTSFYYTSPVTPAEEADRREAGGL